MKKEYFSHDYAARLNPKLIALRLKFKTVGLAVFWVITEMLHEEKNHHLELKDHICSIIAEQSGTCVKQVSAVIEYGINIIGIWKKNSEGIFSERVNLNIDVRIVIAEKRSFAGKKSAEKRTKSNSSKKSKITESTHVQHVETNDEHNPTNLNINTNSINKEESIKNGDFLTKIISVFQTSYLEALKMEYKVVSKFKERKAASTILKLYKEQFPNKNTEETIAGLTDYFCCVCAISNTWYKTNMSLSLIVSKFNEINNLLKSGKQRQISRTADVESIVDAIYMGQGK